MKFLSGGAFFLISVLLINEQIGGASTQVTLEDLRNAILGLVNSYAMLDNKLERHEQRERALGELVKRGLISLQKNVKVYEEIPQIFNRLDDRVSRIETLLITQEETFAELMKTLLGKQADGGKVMASRDKYDSSEEGNSDKFNDLSERLLNSVDSLRKQLEEIKSINDEQTNETLKTAEKLVNSKLTFADEAISRIEEKFSHFYVTGPNGNGNGNSNNAEWQFKVSETLQTIKNDLDSMKRNIEDQPKNGESSSDLSKEFFELLNNETLDAIHDMKHEVLTASDKSFAKTENRINDATSMLSNSMDELGKSLGENASPFEEVNDEIKKNLTAIQSNLEELRKVEKIILQSSEGISDTRKRVEFSVLQVNMAVSELIAQNSKELNASLSKRFNALDESIIEKQNQGLANLSSLIETELGNIWRQIGIMNTDISGSKSALDALQNQTMAYVNGTFSTMDNMGGKVSQITQRMTEVDSNLNYLLGRLGLVTQEFNQIKYGLGAALDNIKASFDTVQSRVSDIAKGPGPHPISEEKLDHN